ncbi:MAG: methionine ABC transporter ATP-binding protein [Peptoniphilaceae bacterium]|nr:methionine ABC transporter ATP-binding protein [Peptoniphilaceae bacterium]MDY6019558.1 methionine ABC transporter ATP-binding protein [Anaerococcus sp.]
MIELKNISVNFDKLKAVDDVSIKINKGDSYGIVGFSGAGKSTLLRTINLLQKPSSGKVIVMGEDLMKLSEKELRARRKKMGMIFQHFNLLSNLSVLENVIYPIRKDKISKGEKIAKAKKLLDLVGLSDKIDSYPRELSGGQKQRCAIARALAPSPQILLCDEATSALDPKTTQQILDLLKKLKEDLDLTIVIITHQMEVVKNLCNRCGVIQDGKIIEEGSTLEIFSNPINDLTKDFVDSTTNQKRVIEEVKKNLGNLGDDEILVKLSYLGSNTTEPIINYIYDKFGVKTNVLAGNIEFISSVPVGYLILTLKGSLEDFALVREYLKEKNTKLEVLGGINEVF